MAARHDPHLIGHARSKRAQGNVVAPCFHNPHRVSLLLVQRVAENAAFFFQVVIARSAQFVEHAPRDKGGGRELGNGMAELLARGRAVVLEQGHVLETQIVLQVLDALCGEAQELADLRIRRLPQLNVVAHALHQHLMRADCVHGVVDAFRAPLRFAFNTIERRGMNHGRGRPGSAFPRVHRSNHLRRARRPWTERTIAVLTRLLGIVTHDDPGARDGVLAQFHATLGKQSRGTASIDGPPVPAPKALYRSQKRGRDTIDPAPTLNPRTRGDEQVRIRRVSRQSLVMVLAFAAACWLVPRLALGQNLFMVSSCPGQGRLAVRFQVDCSHLTDPASKQLCRPFIENQACKVFPAYRKITGIKLEDKCTSILFTIYQDSNWPHPKGEGGLALNCAVDYLEQYSVKFRKDSKIGPYDVHELLHEYQLTLGPLPSVHPLFSSGMAEATRAVGDDEQ